MSYNNHIIQAIIIYEIRYLKVIEAKYYYCLAMKSYSLSFYLTEFG